MMSYLSKTAKLMFSVIFPFPHHDVHRSRTTFVKNDINFILVNIKNNAKTWKSIMKRIPKYELNGPIFIDGPL